jgi:hypothetical protein
MMPYQIREMQLMGVINQHRAAIVALEAIIAAMPNRAEIDREVVKQKVRDSKVFGEQSPEFLSASEATAMRILG